MDVRYFSKGVGSFNSFQISINSPYLILLFEPYLLNKKYYPIEKILGDRVGIFSVLNDNELINNPIHNNHGLRNFLYNRKSFIMLSTVTPRSAATFVICASFSFLRFNLSAGLGLSGESSLSRLTGT